MSLYEIIITTVALLNMALTLTALRTAGHKAATARLDDLERALLGRLGDHEQSITRLLVTAEKAVTHDHLAQVYKAINDVAHQVHSIFGQQQVMNENLRLLLSELARDRGHRDGH
jgi:hypothetical protein